jgi:hypothetical protein
MVNVHEVLLMDSDNIHVTRLSPQAADELQCLRAIVSSIELADGADDVKLLTSENLLTSERLLWL